MEVLQNIVLEITENLKPVAFPIRFANDIERFSPLTQQGGKLPNAYGNKYREKMNTRKKRLKGKVLLIYWKKKKSLKLWTTLKMKVKKFSKPFPVVTKK